MSYTVINFKTKKACREAVQAYHSADSYDIADKDARFGVRCYQPGLGPDLSNYTGRVSLEGPHYPKAHTWYGEGELVNGILVKVK